MDSYNKIEKPEKNRTTTLKINYKLTTPEILVDKHIKEKGKEKEK